MHCDAILVLEVVGVNLLVTFGPIGPDFGVFISGLNMVGLFVWGRGRGW
jgi:hypothetical protein